MLNICLFTSICRNEMINSTGLTINGTSSDDVEENGEKPISIKLNTSAKSRLIFDTLIALF